MATKFSDPPKPLDETLNGAEFRDWRAALKNEGAKHVDKSGSSLADHLEDKDMFGTDPNAMPAPPQGGVSQNQVHQEMLRLVDGRKKQSYSLVISWVLRGSDLHTKLGNCALCGARSRGGVERFHGAMGSGARA